MSIILFQVRDKGTFHQGKPMELKSRVQILDIQRGAKVALQFSVCKIVYSCIITYYLLSYFPYEQLWTNFCPTMYCEVMLTDIIGQL